MLLHHLVRDCVSLVRVYSITTSMSSSMSSNMTSMSSSAASTASAAAAAGAVQEFNSRAPNSTAGVSAGPSSPLSKYSMAPGLKSNLSGTHRHAYRERLVAETLLKQLKVETLDVLGKCRAEIDEFRNNSKIKFKGVSIPVQSTNFGSQSSSSLSLSGSENTFELANRPQFANGGSKCDPQIQEYIRSLENRVAELTLALQVKNHQDRSGSSNDDEKHAKLNGDMGSEFDRDMSLLRAELEKYKTIASNCQHEIKLSNNELSHLRSANRALMDELSASRQESSVLRVRIIELEGLLEGLQQRTVPPSLLQQVGDSSSNNSSSHEMTPIRGMELLGGVNRSRASSLGGTESVAASPIRLREPNSTSKEITQLLANVDLLLSSTPQRSASHTPLKPHHGDAAKVTSNKLHEESSRA
jgi:hypothetical protein